MPRHARPATKLILVSVMLTVFIGPLNSTMASVAVPAIARHFGLHQDASFWVITSYLIAMASLAPTAGKVGDRFGRRRMMMTGLTVFFLCSLGAALAPVMPVLVLGRVGQGVGGALLMPNGIAVLRQVMPPEKVGSTIGLVGIASPLAAAVGPVMGGALLHLAGWRALFGANLVILLIPVTVGWLVLPSDGPRLNRRRFDVLGSALVCVVLVAFSELLESKASRLALISWLPLLAVSFVLFLRRELRHPDPAISPRMLRNPGFSAAALGVMLSNFSMYGALLTLPLILAHRPGWSVTTTGLVLGCMMGAVGVLAPFGGWLVDKLGSRLPAIGGLVLVGIGLGVPAVEGADLPPAALAATLAVAGVGLGLTNPALQTISVNSVPRSEAGVASGIYSTCRYLGSVSCSALLGGLLGLSAGRANPFAWPFLTFAGASLIAATVLVFMLGTVRRPAEPEVRSTLPRQGTPVR